MWADIRDMGTYTVGQIGFLCDIIDTSTGNYRTVFRLQPWSKNMSGERVLSGWCGTTNNINRDAVGAGEITAISRRDPTRVRVRRLADNDGRLVPLCEEHGIRL